MNGNGLFAAVGVVDSYSVKRSDRGYSAMLRVGDDKFYLSGLLTPPALGELFVLGKLHSFKARDCGQLHVGVRPFLVLPASEVSAAVVASMVSQWLSVSVGY